MQTEPPATLPNTAAVATEATPETYPIERRRPGRAAFTNPHLIALLRRRVPANPIEARNADAGASARRPAYDIPKPALADPPEQESERGQLAAPRGIGIGLLIAVPLWASIVALGWCGMVADRVLTQNSPLRAEQRGEVADESQDDRYRPSQPKGALIQPQQAPHLMEYARPSQ